MSQKIPMPEPKDLLGESEDPLEEPMETGLPESWNPACMSGDCTRMVPAGGNLDDETLRSYRAICPFIPPYDGGI